MSNNNAVTSTSTQITAVPTTTVTLTLHIFDNLSPSVIINYVDLKAASLSISQWQKQGGFYMPLNSKTPVSFFPWHSVKRIDITYS